MTGTLGETCGNKDVRAGVGGVQLQSKQAQRSALKSNLILQFRDSKQAGF